MLIYGEEDLPKDAVFPPDLDKLGYFINDQDQIRQLANPQEDFKFKINKNDRWNEVQRNAMNECVRRIVLDRLHALSMATVRLPPGAQPHDRHVPVLCSSNLNHAKRIVVVFGGSSQDLGIWAYRCVGALGIYVGSMIDFAKSVLEVDKQGGDSDSSSCLDTALVIANTGQLVFHCGAGAAVSERTWHALPRQSAVHPPLKQSHRNIIPHNATSYEHVQCVFEGILAARGQMVDADAKIDVVGVAEGADGVIKYLAKNWVKWNQHISAMCFAEPHYRKHEWGTEHAADSHAVPAKESFARFISTRCRAYVLSAQPVEWPVPGTLEYGCNTYSSGEPMHSEATIVSCWRNMLQWLDKLHASPSYEEVELIIQEQVEDDGWEEWIQGEDTIELEE
ncbi:Arb2 domain-containing protein [Talaromyces proteolyticus]|uniref:Arb2 domain-containing protein n=1 Tax=Talaromyces proteolyticus TaxID=1131652 RepID=A0AAD4PWZ7_9EURO|nr:Arb2 domain-containing protein [Talaromyces proteolyticus]KAH8692987.1 Arb2 domain-containing protein [Talaromyces proteolyticus]